MKESGYGEQGRYGPITAVLQFTIERFVIHLDYVPEMIRSLLLTILVFPLGSFIFFYCLFSLREPFLTFEFGADGALGASILAGFFTWLALHRWFLIRQKRSELAIASQIRFEDGEKAVVSGRIQAKGRLLEAPCSGSQCVAYRYKASHTVVAKASGDAQSIRQITDYRGYAMTPFTVKGVGKTISVLGNPDCIEDPAWPDPEIKGSEAENRLRQYLEKTDFGEEVNDRMNGGSGAKTKETYLEPGNFRIDTCAENPKPISDEHRVNEMVIADGGTVLLSGIYYADKDGIGPGANSTLEPLQITPGGAATLEAQIAGYQKTIIILLSLAALTSIIYFAIYW